MDEILSKRTTVHCSKQLFIEGAAVAAWNCQFLFRVQSSFEAFLRRCIYMIKMSINYYLRKPFSRGALTNYVDTILSIIDHLPTYLLILEREFIYYYIRKFANCGHF